MSEDTRPIVEPDMFSFRDFPDGDFDMQEFSRSFVAEMRDVWGGQADFARFTIINDEHPNPPYPHAIYFEGWSLAPERHDPPGRQGPFNYPLVAKEPTK